MNKKIKKKVRELVELQLNYILSRKTEINLSFI